MLLRSLFALVAVLTTSCVSTQPVQTTSGNELRDTDLHVTVTKPEGWRFQTSKEKRDHRTALPFKNTRWRMMVGQETFPPRIVISKYPEPYVGLNPSVSIDRYPLESARFKTSLWLASSIISDYRSMLFTPYTITSGPLMRTLSDKPAAYFRADYDLELINLPTLKIDERMWIIASALDCLIVTVTAPQAASDELTAEIEAILFSLSFDPKLTPTVPSSAPN